MICERRGTHPRCSIVQAARRRPSSGGTRQPSRPAASPLSPAWCHGRSRAWQLIGAQPRDARLPDVCPATWAWAIVHSVPSDSIALLRHLHRPDKCLPLRPPPSRAPWWAAGALHPPPAATPAGLWPFGRRCRCRRSCSWRRTLRQVGLRRAAPPPLAAAAGWPAAAGPGVPSTSSIRHDSLTPCRHVFHVPRPAGSVDAPVWAIAVGESCRCGAGRRAGAPAARCPRPVQGSLPCWPGPSRASLPPLLQAPSW